MLLCLKALSHLVSWGSALSERGGITVHLSKQLLTVMASFVFLFFLPPAYIKRLLIKPVAFLLAILIGFELFPLINKPVCSVVFADVGQGDCCLIMTPSSTCLIDAGTYSEGASTVNDLLDYYGINKVDVCLMSHWDVDHAGGIAALAEKGRVGTILTAYVPSPDISDKDVNEFFESLGYSESLQYSYLSCIELVSTGDVISLSDSVYLEVLYPTSASGGGNEDSVVAMLRINALEETSILFTGDIGTNTESLILETGIDIDCDILKVAHHGSKYSSCEDFIAAASPDIAVISVGKHNFYGHPTPETLSRLESYGCEVFRTDEEGAVILQY